MKRFTLVLALALGFMTFNSASAQAAGVGVNVGVGAGVNVGVGIGFARGGINLQIGTPAFRQRYVAVGQVWVNEPYIYWVTIPDPFTGRLVRVQRIGYTRRLTVLYYDTWQGGYGYFDRYGNPIPWNSRFPW